MNMSPIAKLVVSTSAVAAAALLAPSPAGATILNFQMRNTNNTSLVSGGTKVFAAPAYPTYNSIRVDDYGDHVAGASVNKGNREWTGFPGQSPNPLTFQYGVGSEGYTPNVGIAYSINTGSTNPQDAGVTGPVIKGYVDGQWAEVMWFNDNGAGVGSPTGRRSFITFTPDAGFMVKLDDFDLLSYSGFLHDVTWTLYSGGVSGGFATGSVLESHTLNSFTSSQGVNSLQTATSGYYGGPLTLEINHRAGSIGTLAIDNLRFEQVVPEPASLALVVVGAACVATPRRGSKESRPFGGPHGRA